MRRVLVLTLVLLLLVSSAYVARQFQRPALPWTFVVTLLDSNGEAPLEDYDSDRFTLDYLKPTPKTRAGGAARYSIESADSSEFAVVPTQQPNQFLVSISASLQRTAFEFMLRYPVGNGSITFASDGTDQGKTLTVEEYR